MVTAVWSRQAGDATADRVKASHKTALLDIWMKYADVDTTDAVAEYLRGLPR